MTEPGTSQIIPAAGLLFDMDGVLVDSRAVVERTWRRWGALHRLDPEPLIRVAHGRRTRETLRDMVPQLATDEEVAWLDGAELVDDEPIPALPGATELLSTLPKERWAIVTSAGRELARRRLASAGLPIPRIMVTSDEVRTGKPAPDGYLMAAAALGEAPWSCVVFEDAPPGIRAGRAAGATVIGLRTTYPASDLGEANLLIANLAEVRVRVDEEMLEVEIVGGKR
ncbi:MAG: HAD-IA family hydrolase [Gemmatimonadota bacterium]